MSWPMSTRNSNQTGVDRFGVIVKTKWVWGLPVKRSPLFDRRSFQQWKTMINVSTVMSYDKRFNSDVIPWCGINAAGCHTMMWPFHVGEGGSICHEVDIYLQGYHRAMPTKSNHITSHPITPWGCVSRCQPPFPRIGQHSSSAVGDIYSPWRACAEGASTPAKSPLCVCKVPFHIRLHAMGKQEQENHIRIRCSDFF